MSEIQRTKFCPRCKTERPLEEFPLNRSSKDGRFSYCRPCKVQQMRETKARKAAPGYVKPGPVVCEPGYKFCHGCKTVKLLDDFAVNRNRKDGRQTRCRRCHHKAVRSWARAHPEAVSASNARQRRKDPDQWRAYQKAWRTVNIDRVRHQQKEWRLSNQDKVMASAHRRRARLLAAEGHFTARQWYKKKSEYGGGCAYCRKGGKMTAHHVVPLSRGGTNWIDNIVPACLECNLRIGTKTIPPE